MNLSGEVKITKVLTNTVTGTTTINTTAVDMQGFEGVVFVASLSTAAANNGIKAQQGQAANLSDAADLAGSQILANKTDFVLDIYRPTERYLRAAILRGTTTVIDAVWAIQYMSNKLPVGNITAAQAAELWASPAEGTA